MCWSDGMKGKLMRFVSPRLSRPLPWPAFVRDCHEAKAVASTPVALSEGATADLPTVGPPSD
ncbi:hypothetical protein MPNT_10021 [Candidatus Methylacidithermus pantelleriae]|uniref:Uncharacterized protein n=1 Tax=Candidatus Methylacidithermus pantelleriae TaxID=2744239 RepID=A0A8J2BGY4_9BACT|nr:hypothetical protein MPNT_10021 [Candidatus Methylacidithermus pantelleriae]